MTDRDELAQLADRAKIELDALRRAGRTSEAMNRELADRFERCARAALRRPHPLQRSLLARRVVRRMIPAAWRPGIKRLASRLFVSGRA